MWKAGLVGAVALATMNSTFAFAEPVSLTGRDAQPAEQTDVVVSSAQIARLKSNLRLTAEQEPLWPAVERAFRELSQQAFEEGGADQGLVHKIGSRAVAVGLNAMALRRLAAAAYPLIQTLNDEQKQSAVAFARSVGLENVASAF